MAKKRKTTLTREEAIAKHNADIRRSEASSGHYKVSGGVGSGKITKVDNKNSKVKKVSYTKEQIIAKHKENLKRAGYNLGGLLSVGSSLSNMITSGNETSKGAQAIGSVLNPIGNVSSAIQSGNPLEAIPLVGGLLKGKRLQEEQEIQEKANNFNLRSQIGDASQQRYANLAIGGKLNPISMNAVEVKADHPNLTDSVSLGKVNVDHNEIIDNKDRVFSDELTTKEGKTISKEAKKLEKQKDPNFPKANTLIDKKLDKLFQYQQSINGNNGESNMKKGGMKYQDGGPLPRKGFTPFEMNKGDLESKIIPFSSNISLGSNQNNQPFSKTTDKLGTQLATFGPNIYNAFKLSQTPEVPTPVQESGVNLERISTEDQIADTNRRNRLQRLATNQNTAQSGAANSLNALMRAREIQQVNRIKGAEKRSNAEIASKEALINSAIRSRNINRTNQFNQEKVNRRNVMSNLASQNVSNLAGKVLSQKAEKNLRNLDLKRLDVLKTMYKDSGVFYRNLAKYFNK